jgi:hypothetical protein
MRLKGSSYVFIYIIKSYVDYIADNLVLIQRSSIKLSTLISIGL